MDHMVVVPTDVCMYLVVCGFCFLGGRGKHFCYADDFPQKRKNNEVVLIDVMFVNPVQFESRSESTR